MTDTMIDTPGVAIHRAPRERQWLLHADPGDAADLAQLTGLRLPTQMLTGMTVGEWTALHLSPDEWLLVAEERADEAALAARLADCTITHSLVDVSDRYFAVDVEGERAIDVLAQGCPLDLDRLPDGVCTRTLFGKTTVLLRRAGERWRLDYARSYDGYVLALLEIAAADAAL